jgi:hypothetical protein
LDARWGQSNTNLSSIAAPEEQMINGFVSLVAEDA